MPWFKVDDGLHKSRKRIRLGRQIEGWAALGLWTHLGSWAADELTEGFISDEDLEYHAPGLGCDLAKRLEAVGLFERVTRDGVDGWLFHDWEDFQPAKEQVLADRAANADRQKRFREKAKAAREKAAQAASNPKPDAVSNTSSNGVTNALVAPSVTVPPTRPDPYLELPTEVQSTSLVASVASLPLPVTETPSKRGTRIPEPFVVDAGMTAWAKKRVPHVDIAHETEKFTNFWLAKPGKDGVKTDWVATWHNWMLRASEISGNARSPSHKPFTDDLDKYHHGDL